jgi:hypothetical protein
MTSYPTVSSHYSNNTQDQAYHDPPQFYNPHPPHDTYDQSGYREPEQYQDEPSYSLPQGQSTEPLGMNTKEEPSEYVDELNPTARQPRCVHCQAAQPKCLTDLLKQESSESAGMEIPAGSSPLDTGAYELRAGAL